jgi:hypothetical protein
LLLGCWARAGIVVLTLLLSQLAGAAPEDLVLILRTSETGPRLREAIYRLRGELTQHGFQVEIIDVEGPPSTTELERRADEARAAASVVLVTSAEARDELDKVDVWMSDRITGKTLKRTLSLEQSPEAPTVLAVRTLDLLRSSFAEPKAHSEAPEIEGAHPERASQAVFELRSAGDRTRWLLGAGLTLGYSSPGGGLGLGPRLSGGVEQGRWGGRLVVTALFAEPGAADGTFSLISVTALAEPYALALDSKRFDLGVFPSIGASYLDVVGKVEAPFQGREDSTWVVSLGGGFSLRYFASERFGFFADARALVLLPTPQVEIGSGVVTLGTPLVTWGMGAILAL